MAVVEARAPKRTPNPPPHPIDCDHSSPFNTPITLRQLNKVANNLEIAIGEEEGVDEERAADIQRFIRGSLINATELIQTKRDLHRTQFAQEVAKRHRALKHSSLKAGGVLTVAQGRQMVQRREDEALAKARRVVEAAEVRAHNKMKAAFFDAAKLARKWRLTGILEPAFVCESGKSERTLRRF